MIFYGMDLDLDSEEDGLWNGYGFGFKSIRTHWLQHNI